MRSNKKIILLSVIMTFALWLTACSTPTVARDASDDIPDKTLYSLIAYTITSFETDAYNQNFAGKPGGDVDIEFEGTYGGSIKVTGNINSAADVGLTTRNLTYTLKNVKQITTVSNGKLVCNVTLNGTLKVKGSFNETYKSISYTSSNMVAKGIVTNESSVREFDEAGNISISGQTDKASGEAFGHTIAF